MSEEINSLALHRAEIGDRGATAKLSDRGVRNCSCAATKPGDWEPAVACILFSVGKLNHLGANPCYPHLCLPCPLLISCPALMQINQNVVDVKVRGCNNHRITLICLKAPIPGLLCCRGAIEPNWSHRLGYLVVLEASRLYIVNLTKQAPWPHIKHALVNPSRVDFRRILVRGKLPSRTLESVHYAG